jgi:hypothetical protein
MYTLVAVYACVYLVEDQKFQNWTIWKIYKVSRGKALRLEVNRQYIDIVYRTLMQIQNNSRYL